MEHRICLTIYLVLTLWVKPSKNFYTFIRMQSFGAS